MFDNFDLRRPGTGNGKVLNEIATVGSTLAAGIVELSGFLDEVGQKSQKQVAEMRALHERVDAISSANDALQDAIGLVSELAESNLAGLTESVASVQASNECSREVATWVRSVETRLEEVVARLKSVEKLNAEIQTIARQVNILAINAKIEAVRAGNSGRGFAVVAEAINDLSRNTTKAATAVSESVAEMTKSFGTLRTESRSVQTLAARVITEAEQTDAQMSAMRSQLETTVRTSGTMSQEAGRIARAVSGFGPAFLSIAEGAEDTGRGVEASRKQIHSMVDDSETIVQLSILSGGASEDKKFIDYVVKTAAQIGETFSTAIKKGEISETELFDTNYMPIANTNPKQFMTRYLPLTDQILPRFQEPALEVDPRVVFCAAVDINGYLPTHNQKFSLPQGLDQVWNTANCRNRRIFDDRVGLKSGRNTQPFLMQVYRRDMGGGTYVMMKDLSAPIMVNGRHWGGLRFAYKI